MAVDFCKSWKIGVKSLHVLNDIGVTNIYPKIWKQFLLVLFWSNIYCVYNCIMNELNYNMSNVMFFFSQIMVNNYFFQSDNYMFQEKVPTVEWIHYSTAHRTLHKLYQTVCRKRK